MKYKNERYQNSYMYKVGNNKFRFLQQHIVKSRSERLRGICSSQIPAYSESVYVEQAWKPVGWFRCWICEDCFNRWLEATHQIREGDIQK